jgi:hypothetical protein
MLPALGANWRVMASLALALPAPAAPTEAAAAAARAPAVMAEPAPAPAPVAVAPAAAPVPVVPAAAPVAPAAAPVAPAAAPVASAPAAVVPAAAPVAPAPAPVAPVAPIVAPAPAPATVVNGAAAAAAAAAAACFDLPPALSKVSGGGSGAFGAFVHSQLGCCKLQVKPKHACAVLSLSQHRLPMRSITSPTKLICSLQHPISYPLVARSGMRPHCRLFLRPLPPFPSPSLLLPTLSPSQSWRTAPRPPSCMWR